MINNRDMFMGYSYPYMDNDINMRLNILERNIRRLEERISKLEGNTTYSTDNYMNNNMSYNNTYPNSMYNMI